MTKAENFVFEFVSTLSWFAGLSVYELWHVLTGQDIEKLEKERKIDRLITSILNKVSPQGFLIGGGILLLLIVFVIRQDAIQSEPYGFFALVAGGLGSIVTGIQWRIETQFPRLAKWLTVIGAILCIAMLFFFVLMFFYE